MADPERLLGVCAHDRPPPNLAWRAPAHRDTEERPRHAAMLARPNHNPTVTRGKASSGKGTPVLRSWSDQNEATGQGRGVTRVSAGA